MVSSKQLSVGDIRANYSRWWIKSAPVTPIFAFLGRVGNREADTDKINYSGGAGMLAECQLSHPVSDGQ